MEQRWIPVAERLPEDGTYLTTLDGELVGQEEPFTGMCGIENGKWDEDGCVIAWMPLPEPYREGELPKQTNADRIRSMTDEELTKYLPMVSDFICQPTEECIKNTITYRGECEKTEECAMKWLRAESEV